MMKDKNVSSLENLLSLSLSLSLEMGVYMIASEMSRDAWASKNLNSWADSNASPPFLVMR
jgi:hypothetical protein